ncbi:cytosolic phospholipase A2 gamma-like [Mixophyes fleayi]|uniref:cytosolic phospholipase A2 gamma-like n=1 Tax=Mixophyes fleayi TaxID=3061075 RepID=UPI003F4E066B
MVGLLGTLAKLAEEDLLDIITYVCGVSGSTWCMSSLYNNDKWSSCMQEMEDQISDRLINSTWDISKTWEKLKEAFSKEIYSLTSFWAYAVVHEMTKKMDEKPLSNHQASCESGENPYPIYSAVEKRLIKKNKPGAWFEFTPHLAGFPAYKSYVNTELIGSQFKGGDLLKNYPENDLCYLQGLWGSAPSTDNIIRELIKATLFIPLRNSNRSLFPMETSEVSAQKILHETCDPSGNTEVPHALNRSEGERSSIKARQKKVSAALQKLGINATKDKEPPIIAILASGGGVRAMVGLLGTLAELAKEDLLDAITYVCGVSGSTWCMSSLYNNDKWSSCMSEMECLISDRLTKSTWNSNKAWEKLKETFSTEIHSLTNFWAYVVVHKIINEINEKTLSDHQASCESGENPYPVYSAVEKGHLNTNKPGAWFEFTPHLVGFPAYKSFVSTALFGSQFKEGKLLRNHPERDLCYLQGLWGSALSGDDFIHNVIKDNIKKIFPNNLASKSEEYLCPCSGCQKLTTLVSHDLAGMTDEEIENYCSHYPDTMEKNFDDKVTASMDFAKSGSCEMVKVIFHILKSLIEWKWGTTNNFLYECKTPQMQSAEEGESRVPHGLGEVTPGDSNKEQAVLPQANPGAEMEPAGNNAAGNVPHDIYSQEYIYLIDAGLEINAAYPLMLPPNRKVDLILSYDYSEGDPFLTLKSTAEYCKSNEIPFPKISIEDKEMEIPSKSCYVFEGDDKGTPDIMHFPLFNNQNCEGKVNEMRINYATRKLSYDASELKELLRVSKLNVELSKQHILEKLQKCIECN